MVALLGIMETPNYTRGENEMAETSTSNTGFEKQIWDAACVLRGNMDASEYKSVVLGLIFLKYISDRFEAKYNEPVVEEDSFRETALRKTLTSTHPRTFSSCRRMPGGV